MRLLIIPNRQETVAVMLGNMSNYPRMVGEWVRLKASPSVEIIRSLLLGPSNWERLARWELLSPERIMRTLRYVAGDRSLRSVKPRYGSFLDGNGAHCLPLTT